LPELFHIQAHHLAAELPYLAAEDDGVDIPDVGRRNDGTYRVVRRIKVDVIRSDHHDVGFLTRREGPAFVEQARVCSAINSRAF